MARVSLSDQRALCFHVLTHRTSEHCKVEFVAVGGLRIIRQWMLAAVRDDCVGELRAMVELLGSFSLDAKSLRRYELGKLLRRLTRLRSTKNGIEELNAEAKRFIGTSRNPTLTVRHNSPTECRRLLDELGPSDECHEPLRLPSPRALSRSRKGSPHSRVCYPRSSGIDSPPR